MSERKQPFIPCDNEGKIHVYRLVSRTVDDITEAIWRLNFLQSKLNLMDVRHDDFASDASLREHTLTLQDMAKDLINSIQSGSYLHQHFDRSNQDANS